MVFYFLAGTVTGDLIEKWLDPGGQYVRNVRGLIVAKVIRIEGCRQRCRRRLRVERRNLIYVCCLRCVWIARYYQSRYRGERETYKNEWRDTLHALASVA